MQIDLEKLEAAINAQRVTKSELARRSGVSRTAIYGILRGRQKQVRNDTIRRLAATLNLSADHITIGGSNSSYLKWVDQQYGEFDFHGLGLGQLQPVPLSQLFVNTEVGAGPLGKDSRPTPDTFATTALESSQPVAESVDFAQAVLRHDRIVLVGGPGSGKTTLLRHLAVAATNGQHGYSSPQTPRIPLFARLSEFIKAKEQDNQLDLVGFIAARVRQSGHPDPENFLREELRRGTCSVLLDGLDEVARDGPSTELRHCLTELIQSHPRNQYVLSARQVGFDERPWLKLGFAPLRITPWGDRQIEQFIRQWYERNAGKRSARAKRDAAQHADELLGAIRRNVRLKAVATNPLMLVILAALHHGQAILPRRRVELYAKITDTLLQSWEAAKFAARPGDLLHGTVLEGREYAWLLGHLALEMQTNDLTVAPHWWLADHVRGFLHETLGLDLQQAKQECDRVIQYLGERTGLLVERGRGLYAFWHLTFQEYFAARTLAQQAAAESDRGLVDILEHHFYHPRWAEVVRLVASQLAPTQTPPLLRAILDDPDPAGRFLHRGSLLALGCLADGAVVADSQLVDRVFASVLDLGTSHWLGITVDALHILREFAGTRLADKADATVASILAAAETHLSAAEVFRLRQAGDQQFRRQIAHALETGVLETGVLETGVPAQRPSEPPRLGTSVAVESPAGRIAYHYLDPQAKATNPRQWYARAEKLLLDNHVDEGLQVALVRTMATAVQTAPSAGQILLKTLQSSSRERIREGCADSLGQLAVQDPNVRNALVDRFKSDPNDAVRHACGASLRHVAADDEAVRAILLSAFEAKQPANVRAGAAIGLKRVAENDPSIRSMLRQRAESPDEDATLRVFCLGALEKCLNQDRAVLELFVRLLESDSPESLRDVASEVLAKALARRRIPWDPTIAQRVQQNLINTRHPRDHHLAGIRELVKAREIRAARRESSCDSGAANE